MEEYYCDWCQCDREVSKIMKMYTVRDDKTGDIIEYQHIITRCSGCKRSLYIDKYIKMNFELYYKALEEYKSRGLAKDEEN